MRKGFKKRLIAAAACAACLLWCLAGASAAFATDYEDEEAVATEEQIADALERGYIINEMPADQFGVSDRLMLPGEKEESFYAVASTNYRIKTIAGDSLYDTAAAEALYAYSSSSYVIIASGVSPVDALSATSLAGALNCPILLTPAESLPTASADAIRSLGAMRAIIVGGPAVISEDVANQLKSITGLAPERLWGNDQFDTQLAIYSYGLARNAWSDTLIVARGVGNPADALSAAPLAYALKAPVFLVDETGALPAKSMQRLASSSSFNRVLALGGTAVLSERTFGTLQGIALAGGGSSSDAIRIAGDSLYDTSVAIAQWSVDNGYLSWDNAAFTTGLKPFDALAGSVVQGAERSVMLLCDADDATAANALVEHKSQVHKYKYFGGRAIYTNAQKLALAYDMGFSLVDIEGMIVYIDAGHGWNSSDNGVWDGGASGNGYWEANLTVELARMVCNDLNVVYGIETYCNDDGGPYTMRNAEAAALNCGCLVSIHFNANGGSGTETYIHTVHAAPGAAQLQANIHPRLVTATGLVDRGALQRALAVCGGSVPGTLLEICFIDDAGDMEMYAAKKTSIAAAIAAGIAA